MSFINKEYLNNFFIDSGGKNINITAVFTKLYNIKRIMVSVYYL